MTVSPYMERALALARSVKGRTSPNPAVGAVLVRDGRVVGEGATRPYGQAHAEVVAIEAAGEAAQGATMYVTLEPCSHYGRTPPCTNAIVAAGVAGVIMSTLDPNPRVAGAGRRALDEAGIWTEVGEGKAAAQALNEDFAHWITTGRPWVVTKFGASLDGKIATRTGESRWITGAEARTEAHRWRDRVDCILVGVGTVLADDPALTTRLEGEDRPLHHPWRVVLDSECRTPVGARLLSATLPARTSVVTTPRAPEDRRRALEAAGAEVIVGETEHGRVAIPQLLEMLGTRGITSLLVEGGATVHGAFFDAGAVDYVLAFLAPLVIGGGRAPGAVGGEGPARLAEARRLLETTVRQVGADTLVAGPLRRVRWPD